MCLGALVLPPLLHSLVSASVPGAWRPVRTHDIEVLPRGGRVILSLVARSLQSLRDCAVHASNTHAHVSYIHLPALWRRTCLAGWNSQRANRQRTAHQDRTQSVRAPSQLACAHQPQRCAHAQATPLPSHLRTSPSLQRWSEPAALLRAQRAAQLAVPACAQTGSALPFACAHQLHRHASV